MANSIGDSLKQANYRAGNYPDETELAQLSKSRGEKAAKSNSPTIQRDFIKKQGDVEDAARKGGTKMTRDQFNDLSKEMPAYKKGGKVRKTGKAILHKGEKVLTVKGAKKVERSSSRAKTKKAAGSKKYSAKKR